MTRLYRVFGFFDSHPWIPLLFFVPILLIPFSNSVFLRLCLLGYGIAAIVIAHLFYKNRQKKSQMLLNQARDHFSKVFNSRAVCISISSMDDGRFIDVNQEFLTTFGYERDEVIGRTSQSLGAFPNDGERKNFIKTLKNKGFVKDFDILINTPGKGTIPVSFSADIIRFKGADCILSVLLDISERKRLEEELKKAMFDASQVAADAEIKNYQLEMEMNQRGHAEKLNQVLFGISNAVNTTRDLEELYASIHKILGAVLILNNFFIALHNKKQDKVSFPYYVDRKDKSADDIHEISKKDSLTIAVIKTQKPLLLKADDFSDKGKYAGRKILGTPAQAWLGVPLKVKDEVIGVMATQSYTDPDRFSELDINLMETASEQIALAIERKKAQDALSLSEIKHRSIIEGVKDGYCETDLKGRFDFFNEALCLITGYSRNELTGLPLTKLLDNVGNHNDFLRQLIADQENETSFQIIQKNGIKKHISIRPTLMVDEDDNPTGYRTFVRDIDTQKQYEEKLVFLAYHDPLTGLNNRKGFYEFLDTAYKTARRNNTCLGVMYMDIDKFKQVNDTMGHEIGDALLTTISQRLTDNLRETDFISRIGGDEFTVVITNDASFHPDRLATKLLNAISYPYDLNGHTIDYVSASIGISLFPDDDIKGIEDFVQKADQAMYEAKRKRNTFVFFKDMPTLPK